MYGEIGKDTFHVHGASFTEGKIYKITRFTVSEAKSGFKAVDSKFMIRISVHTKVTEKSSDSVKIPLYTFRTTEFSDVASLAGDKTSFVGIIIVIFYL